MITRLRNILGLQTTGQKIEEYSLLKGELDDINGMTDELAESYLSRVNGFNEVLKSDNYSPEIKESVQKRYNNFLDGQKKEVIGLVNRRHKIEKSISSILKDDKIKEAVNEFEVLNNAKRNYKEGAISKNIYNEIIKSKKGKVHYSDNFVFWNDKLLLIQRATDDNGANKWCLPGGHVDAGESHEKAAVRELVEETGIEVKNAVLAGVYENEDVMIEYYTSSVESETEPSILLDSSEHQSYKWFDVYKESLDDMEFPFNMKENIKKILLPEEVEAKNISKAVNMFIDGYISKEVLGDIVKARTGYYLDNSENRRLKRVGQKYGSGSISYYGKDISREQYEKISQQIDDNKIKYEKVKEVFGGDTKLESISNICNFVGGSKIFKNIKSLYIEETQSGIEIALETADLSMERLYEGVDKVVHHISFQVNEKRKGLGTDIFNKQITSYVGKGYKVIETFATKNEISNGYYTWARLGFDFAKESKEESMFSDLIKMSELREVNSSKNLTDLMKTEEGRKFWKDFGFPFVGVFDLGKDSENIKTFKDYYNGKNKK